MKTPINIKEEDKKQINDLKKFEKSLRTLLQKHPNIKLYGTKNGDVIAMTTVGSGLGTRSISTGIF